jgi:hypothetical protein
VVWSLKRFFVFLNAAGLSDVRIDGLLAHAAPRRVRALPCFTREETGCLIKGIDTGTPCGKRDYAMVALAVSTGLRCCDIVALRLDEIDWRRDEIRLVQAKTSRPLVLPLPALAGNAVAEWILHGRPACDAPEVFVRLQPPFVKVGNSAGSTLMRRRLTRAGIDHQARDGKSFHAPRRTAGTRLIESGAGLPLAAQILGLSPDPKNPLNDVSTMNKTMEYMAYELPVVAFDLRETRVSAGDAAVYVTPNDVREYAEAIVALMDGESARARMAKLGRARVEQELAWSRQRRAYLGVYQDLTAARHAGD